jgi:2-amino-4-hydroxy-6-hydroxymethyldihydropteridine diphosphokinase
LTPASLAFVGLGANLPGAHGKPGQALDAALDALAALPSSNLEKVSRLYASDPVEADGPPFFNRVAAMRSSLAPEALLDELHKIEERFGRERPYLNAPRTLDLDLLMVEDLQVQTPRLTLPHPRMHERLFVLMPLAELEPGLVIPGHGKVADCLAVVHATQSQRCWPSD